MNEIVVVDIGNFSEDKEIQPPIGKNLAIRDFLFFSGSNVQAKKGYELINCRKQLICYDKVRCRSG